jgi:N-acetylmuramoyl-L-alanine amidase CwlA
MTINKKQIAYNRTPRNQKPQYIVIHDTGNTGAGANANAHFNYFNSGDRQASADFFVDKDQTLQVNDYLKYYTWHCGDGNGKYGISNGNSLGIEICVNSDGDYNAAYAKTVELTRFLMAGLGISAARVVRHYDASRKNCPASMAVNNWQKWNEFKAAIAVQNEGELTMTQYEELTKRLDDIEKKIPAAPMAYNYIDQNMPDWAHPTIQKLTSSGFLQGDGGGLGLTGDMLRLLVILDRAGAFAR